MVQTRRADMTIQTSLQGIAKKASEHPKHRFQDLMRLLSVESLIWCCAFLKKKAAAGVDKIDYYMFMENCHENIVKIVESLKTGSYKAKLVRRKWIPKGKDKLRPLGIPAIADKLLQMLVSKILQAIYEQDFLPCSFGYRPNLGPLDAVKEISRKLQFGQFSYVVEADIKGFFDNINHDWMITMLEERVDDRRFLRLIRKWLSAGILEEDGETTHPVTGTPQGGIVSPVLANIYLHYALDLWFEKCVKRQCRGESMMIRYCDDFVCAFQFKEDAEMFYASLGDRLKKFNLEVAPEKTNIIPFGRHQEGSSLFFDFLSFEFRWGVSLKGKKIVTRRTSRKKLRNSVANFTDWIKKNRCVKLKLLIKKLNSKYRGYWNYYGVIGNYSSLAIFYKQTKDLLFKWLNRRSQRISYNRKTFDQMLDSMNIAKPRITEKNVTFCGAK
jgi:RNA-directed DNA polymerase